jgi:alpha-tubulin suppressor-like RCC1 family protein
MSGQLTSKFSVLSALLLFWGGTSCTLQMNRTASYDPAATIQVATLPSSVTAGVEVPLQISMLAEDGRLAVDYRGRLVLSSTDARITLSSELVLAEADAGYQSAEMVLKTSGTQKITLQDSENAALQWSGEITVNPATLTSLAFRVGPTPQVTMAQPIAIEITAADRFGNSVDNSLGAPRVQLGLNATNSAALGGTASGNLSSNVLTLAPTVDQPGTGYSFTASILGSTVASATSASFDVLGPSLTLSPSTLNFDTVGIGTTSSARVITITNSGTLAASSCSSASLSGNHPTDFAIAADGCSNLSLAANSSCLISITASPTSAGTRSATLSRSCTVGGTVTTATNGITATASGASLAFSPTSFDFRKVQLRSPNASSAVFTLSNAGPGVASGCSAPALSGNQSSDYTIDGDGCGTASLAANSSCTVTVRPGPTSTGSRTATLSRVCTSGGTASTTANGIQVFGVRFRPKSFSVGSNFVCALLGDGSVVCWGSNGNGQLGTENSDAVTSVGGAGNSLSTATPVNLGLGKTAVGISAGAFHACTLLNDGTVKCWGLNTKGQLGQDNTQSIGYGPPCTTCTLMRNLEPVNLGTGMKALKVVAGSTNTCALLHDGTVKCWGENASGVLGQDNTTDAGCGVIGTCTLMADLPAISTFGATGMKAIDLELGLGNTACVILSNGTLTCWGSNSTGQLGLSPGSTTNAGCGAGGGCTPMSGLDSVDLGGSPPKKVSIGSAHACAVRADGYATCWGEGANGRLGINSTTDVGCGGGAGCAAANSVLAIGNSFKGIATGSGHSCGLLADGKVYCWGKNNLGQLGRDNTTEVGNGTDTAMAVLASGGGIVFTGSAKVKQIGANGDTSCALLDSGEIQCWGDNTAGQLGVDSTTGIGCGGGCNTIATSSVDLGLEPRAIKVQTSGEHSCALLTNGEIYCWGRNNTGQLGQDHTSSIGASTGALSTLTPVNIGTGVKAIDITTPRASSPAYTCAVTSSGKTRCWGANESGQLGQNSVLTLGDDSGEMAALSDIADLGGSFATVDNLQTGAGHSCTVSPSGDFICWGKNTVGQLGHDDTVNYGAAMALAGGLNSLANIFGGGNINAGGGAMGPIVLDYSTGNRHTCALVYSSGGGVQVRCFGVGFDGELGYGNNTQLGHAGGGSSTASIGSVPISNPIDVIAGGTSTCAIASDRTLRCWGSNGASQLGIDAATGNIGTAAGEVAALSAVPVGNTRIWDASISESHGCAITSDFSLRCWGENVRGNLGQDNVTTVSNGSGPSVSAISAVQLGSDRKAIQVSVGMYATCAVLDNGEIKCFGDNTYGQLGIESIEESWGDSSNRSMNALSPVKLP